MTLDEGLIYEIEGGAGADEAAAIGAAVVQLLAEEAAAAAVPRTPPRQSAWVLAWRPSAMPPVTAQQFDRQPRWNASGVEPPLG